MLACTSVVNVVASPAVLPLGAPPSWALLVSTKSVIRLLICAVLTSTVRLASAAARMASACAFKPPATTCARLSAFNARTPFLISLLSMVEVPTRSAAALISAVTAPRSRVLPEMSVGLARSAAAMAAATSP